MTVPKKVYPRRTEKTAPSPPSAAATASLVAIAARYTTLRRVGGGYAGPCPYPDHRDTDSEALRVSGRGYYWCSGCRRGGDAARLVEDLEGFSRGVALAVLADRAGAEPGGEAPPVVRRRRAARKALGYAARYYAKLLLNSEHHECRRAREHLEGRGLSRELLAAFGVGYAPSRRAGHSFCELADGFGLRREALRDAGLAVGDESPQDRFAGRITFPTRDHRGRVLGFGGRVLPGAETYTTFEGEERTRPKYVNSPDSDVYRKRELLYGLERAARAIRRERRALVVEGYTDVLMLHQSGVKTAVGIAGTAPSRGHLRLLAPHADTIYLALDPDEAGEKAVRRAREAAEVPLDLRVVALDKDPADWLQGGRTAGEFRELLSGAEPLLEHEVGRLAGRLPDPDPGAASASMDATRRLLEAVLRDADVRRRHEGLVGRLLKAGVAGAPTSAPRAPGGLVEGGNS